MPHANLMTILAHIEPKRGAGQAGGGQAGQRSLAAPLPRGLYHVPPRCHPQGTSALLRPTPGSGTSGGVEAAEPPPSPFVTDPPERSGAKRGTLIRRAPAPLLAPLPGSSAPCWGPARGPTYSRKCSVTSTPCKRTGRFLI